MKLTISKNEMTKVTGLMKNIFEKATAQLELPSPFLNGEVPDFGEAFELYAKEGVIESATATIMVVGDELIIEIKPEFVDDYLTLMSDISNDLIEFAAVHKAIISSGVPKAAMWIYKKTKAVVMAAMNLHLHDVVEPGKELLNKIKGRFEAFGEKY